MFDSLADARSHEAWQSSGFYCSKRSQLFLKKAPAMWCKEAQHNPVTGHLMGLSVKLLFDRGATWEEAGIATQHSLLSLYKWYLVLLGLLISHEQGSSSAGLLHKHMLVCDLFQDLLEKQGRQFWSWSLPWRSQPACTGAWRQHIQKLPGEHQELLNFFT